MKDAIFFIENRQKSPWVFNSEGVDFYMALKMFF